MRNDSNIFNTPNTFFLTTGLLLSAIGVFGLEGTMHFKTAGMFTLTGLTICYWQFRNWLNN